MVNIFAWVKNVDDKIDPNNNTNRFFASYLVIFAFIAGCFVGMNALRVLSGTLNRDLFIWCCPALTLACVFLIMESIVACSSVKTIILRAIVSSAFVWLGYGVGILAGIVFWIMIALVVLMIGLAIFSLFSGSFGKSGNKYKLSDGTIVTKKTGLLGDESYSGNDGYDYERSGNEFYRK